MRKSSNVKSEWIKTASFVVDHMKKKKEKCFAFGKSYSKCGKQNHFKEKCSSKTAQTVEPKNDVHTYKFQSKNYSELESSEEEI